MSWDDTLHGMLASQQRRVESATEPPLPPPPSETYDVTYYVDGTSGSDGNAGTSGSPVATIGRAVDLADAANVNGQSALVTVAAGTYREFVTIDDSTATTTAALEVEGVGDVAIVGSEIYTGWSANGDGTWTHSWTFNWGYWAINPQWSNFDDQLIAYPVIRRREIVYVDGTRLDPVDSAGALVAGTFYVDEAANEITIATDPTGATVEVGEREKCLLVNWRDNVTVRNLACKYAANDLQQASAAAANSNSVTFVDCDFSDNGYKGLGVFNTIGLTATGLTASGNGFVGASVSASSNVTFTDCTTSYNNWRGGINQDEFATSFADIDAGGIKILNSGPVTCTRVTARFNLCVAIWFDFSNTDGTIEDCDLSDNSYYGSFIEASPGPFTISGTNMCRNEKGLRIANSTDGTVDNCIISGNDYAQVWVTGQWERNGLVTRNWTVTNTRLESDTDQLTYAGRDPTTVFPEFASTLTAGGNTWTHPTAGSEVLVEFGSRISFATWQSTYSVDATSTETAASPAC